MSNVSTRRLQGALATLSAITLSALTSCATSTSAPASDCVERSGDICITEAATRAAYDRYAQARQGLTEYEVRHILVDDRAQAQSALDRIHAGESFASVARAVSKDTGSSEKGGDLGWSLPAYFVPEFSAEMTALAPHGLSAAPVRSQFGWHVIEVTGMRPLQVKPYAAMRNELAYMMLLSAQGAK